MSFLTAEWHKLAFANYEIDPALLKPYVPYGTELDLWQGRCFCSLIGFMFLNTKLLGFKIPFHVNFEEVNLRFYVKCIEGHQSRVVEYAWKNKQTWQRFKIDAALEASFTEFITEHYWGYVKIAPNKSNEYEIKNNHSVTLLSIVEL